jgi:glycine/D-amino acid oxidase-like deaminating enzyme
MATSSMTPRNAEWSPPKRPIWSGIAALGMSGGVDVAGAYDITPDANPIVGPVDDVEHFYQVSGFMGHGFMMAPIIGKLLAEQLVRGTTLPMFERWNLRRFKEGNLLSEAMIIG